MIVSLIVACGVDKDKNLVIGNNGTLPWYSPRDLARFRSYTLDHTVIMGRKTFESIGKPLPKRRNIVVTRNKSYAPKGVTVVNSLQSAFDLTAGEVEVFVIGGQIVYEQALERAQRLYFTVIPGLFEGDAFFPRIDWSKFKSIHEETFSDGERFGIYERIKREGFGAASPFGTVPFQQPLPSRHWMDFGDELEALFGGNV